MAVHRPVFLLIVAVAIALSGCTKPSADDATPDSAASPSHVRLVFEEAPPAVPAPVEMPPGGKSGEPGAPGKDGKGCAGGATVISVGDNCHDGQDGGNAAPREAAERYVGAWLGGYGSPAEPWPDCDAEIHVAGACFPFLPDEVNATITIKDDLAAEVCAVAALENATGYIATAFCGEAHINLQFAPGATTLRVKIVPSLGDAPPVSGRITVRFEPQRSEASTQTTA